MAFKLRAALVLMVIFSTHAIAAAEAARGDQGMDRIRAMENNRSKLFGPAQQSGLAITDPELVAIRDRLMLGEIAGNGSLDDKQRELVAIVALAASQATAAMGAHVEAALNVGAAPVAIREAVYQIAPYIGFPRSEAAIAVINQVFEKRGIKVPLEQQGTVSEESRFRDGLAVQKKIFGAGNIEKMQANAPKGQQEIVTNYLSAFCFGDFYTRKGLDLKMRELVTFSAIVALGGCDPQAKAHAAANISVGNSKQNLVDALAAMLPFIGFPRTLNGLAAVNTAIQE